MKTLLAIIAAASLVVGCGVFEEEQTSIDATSGGTTSAPSAPAPTVANWSGTKQLGTSGDDKGEGITTDSSGNVYVTGRTYGGLDGNTNAGYLTDDFFVVKYDSSGDKQWTKQLGTYSDDVANGIATDSSGNIYVTGYTSGGLDGNTSAGSRDLFVVKYDSGGTKQWTQQLGSASDDVAKDIHITFDDSIYITGYTEGGLDGNTNLGGKDIFVVRYDSDGNKQWTQQFGTSSDDVVNGITSPQGVMIYITGYTEGSLSGSGVSNAGGRDIFIAALDNRFYGGSSSVTWIRQLGTSSSDSAHGITTDSSGNIYVTGSTGGALNGNTNAGFEDLFVMKYGSAGNYQWTQQIGEGGYDYGRGIATDSSDNVYVAGALEPVLNGNRTYSDDIFVVKYDSAGVKQWDQQLTHTSWVTVDDSTIDSSGNVYVTGYTPIGFDGNTHLGGGDAFIVKYDTNGYKQ